MKCKVIVLTITATYCYDYFSMYKWILSALIAYVVNLRGDSEVEGLESTVGVLEVIQASEEMLEAVLGLSFGCFGGSLSFWCANF